MIYYSLFIASSVFLLFLSRLVKGTAFLFYSVVLFSIFFSGLRFNAGNDFPTYYGMSTGTIGYDRLELIPKTIMDVSVYFDAPFIFFLITSAVYISCVAYFCSKLSDNKELSFLIFLLFPLSFLTSLGYVRQFMSIGFFLCALVSRLENKNTKSLLFMISSIFCHASSVFFIPVIIFNKILSKKKIPAILSLSIIVFAVLSSKIILNYSYLAGRYEHYLTGSNVVDAGKKIGYISMLLLAYLYILGKNIKSNKDVFLFNVYVIFCVIYAFLMDFGEYVVRISYFLFPSLWILMTKTIILKGKSQKYLQIFLIISFGLVMFFTTLYLAKNNPTRDFLTDYSIIFFI